MKLNNLLLLTLTALASQGIQAMNRTAIDTEAAAQRAEQFVQSMTTGEQVPHAETEVNWHGFESTEDSPQASVEQKATAATSQEYIENKATTASLFEQWPQELHNKGKEPFSMNELLRYAGTLPINQPEDLFTAVATDGKQMLAYFGGSIVLCDIATGIFLKSPLYEQLIEQNTVVALSENYQVMATTKNKITAIEIRNRKTNEAFSLTNFIGDLDYMNTIAISKDERYVAGTSTNHKAFIWHKQENNSWTLLFLCSFNEEGGIEETKITFSNNNQFLVITSNHTVQIMEVATGNKSAIFTNNNTITTKGTKPISCCAVSPDDRLVIIGSYSGVITIHDMLTGKLVQMLPAQTDKNRAIHMVRTNSNGQQVITGDRFGFIRIWDWKTARVVQTLPPDNKFLFTVYGTTDHACPYIILSCSGELRTYPFIIKMTPEAMSNILSTLSLEQLEFIRDLIQVRHKQTQKDGAKELILSEEQSELIKTLPLFVQTALRTNLNLNTELHKAINITSMMNTQCGYATSTALQRLIYDYAKPENT